MSFGWPFCLVLVGMFLRRVWAEKKGVGWEEDGTTSGARRENYSLFTAFRFHQHSAIRYFTGSRSTSTRQIRHPRAEQSGSSPFAAVVRNWELDRTDEFLSRCWATSGIFSYRRAAGGGAALEIFRGPAQ